MLSGGDTALSRDGAVLRTGAASAAIAPLRALLEPISTSSPGGRIIGLPGLGSPIDGDAPIASLAREQLGSAARPVRAVLLDKTPATNWGVGWHQDRTIAVEARYDIPGFGPWTVKRGIPHVAPPFKILAAMLTLRIHLDDVPQDNAPLVVATGTHRLGRIAEADVGAAVAGHNQLCCIAQAGDVWMYATPILHMSAQALQPGQRRVLQVDYCAIDLPDPLRWAGI